MLLKIPKEIVYHNCAWFQSLRDMERSQAVRNSLFLRADDAALAFVGGKVYTNCMIYKDHGRIGETGQAADYLIFYP